MRELSRVALIDPVGLRSPVIMLLFATHIPVASGDWCPTFGKQRTSNIVPMVE
jgi:hypothetical protein